MKKIIIFFISFFLFYLNVEWSYYNDNFNFCSTLDWSKLIADDWEYLWLLSNKYNIDSVANKYSNYWSKYNLNSIFNKYWTYWSKYNLNSPWNKYSSNWPIIINWDLIYWRLTLNKFSDWALNTFSVLLCFLDISDDRLEPYLDLLNNNTNTYNIENNYCWKNSYLNSNWKCVCNIWYEWGDKINTNNYDCVEKMTECLDTVNGFLWTDWKCYCNTWYYWSNVGNKCIKKKTYTEMCQETYGLNSYWDESYCYCNTWYEWNSWKTSCIKIKEKTAIEMCQESYWLNSTSDWIKNNDWTYNCSCKSWYEWNSSKTSCVIKINSLSSTVIDKNKQTAEILFNKIKNKTSNFSQDKKDKVYKSLLEKIEVLRSKSKWDTLKILDYLKDFINNDSNATLDDLFWDLFNE